MNNIINQNHQLALNQAKDAPPEKQIFIFLHIFQLSFDSASIYDYFLFLCLFLLNLRLKNIMINRILMHILNKKILISIDNIKDDNINENQLLSENIVYTLNDLKKICKKLKNIFDEKIFLIEDKNFLTFLENICKKFYYMDEKDFNQLNLSLLEKENNTNSCNKLQCSICKRTSWNNKQIPVVIDPDAINIETNTFEPRYICLNCLIVH